VYIKLNNIMKIYISYLHDSEKTGAIYFILFSLKFGRFLCVLLPLEVKVENGESEGLIPHVMCFHAKMKTKHDSCHPMIGDFLHVSHVEMEHDEEHVIGKSVLAQGWYDRVILVICVVPLTFFEEVIDKNSMMDDHPWIMKTSGLKLNIF